MDSDGAYSGEPGSKSGAAPLRSRHVFLCTGSHPRLPFIPLHKDQKGHPSPVNIPMDVAISPGKLAGVVTPEDTVAVVVSE